VISEHKKRVKITMKQLSRFMSPRLTSMIIGSALFVGGAVVATAQQEATQSKPAATKRSNAAGRDPFKKYQPPRIVVKKSNLVMPPSIEERIAQYRAQKQAAMNARIAAPKPTTALTLSELQVVGISRTPRGYAAIIEATPIKMSFVIYPGEKFYDGQLVAIEDNRLVFRREVVYTDGRRERTVDLKPLRAPSTIDVFAAAKVTPSAQTSASVDAEKSSEKPAPDKP
jgi:hypothetical protein